MIFTVLTPGHSKLLILLSAQFELICTAPQTIPHAQEVLISRNYILLYAVSQKSKTKKSHLMTISCKFLIQIETKNRIPKLCFIFVQ